MAKGNCGVIVRRRSRKRSRIRKRKQAQRSQREIFPTQRLGRGFLALYEIRLLKTSHPIFDFISRSCTACRGSAGLAASSSRQRTRHPMTVASIGVCRYPHCAKHRYSIGTKMESHRCRRDPRKEVKAAVRRRNMLVREGVDSLLPRRHAVSIIPVVMNLMCAYSAAMASRRAYITATNA